MAAGHLVQLDVGASPQRLSDAQCGDSGAARNRMPALFKRVRNAQWRIELLRHVVILACPGPRGAFASSASASSLWLMSFWSSRRVVVTGGAGFLGRRVVAHLEADGADVVAPRSAEFDLTVPGTADTLLATYEPSVIVHLAARVGGIGYNLENPAPLYLSNLLMGTYVIEAARHAPSVERTVLLGTVCSYPKITPVPFIEANLWEGYPEETNAPYGVAKKVQLIHAQVNAEQYGQQFAYVIPTNLYGPGDKFHPAVSHVIPALIKKCVDAVESGADHVQVWGTGAASREYLYVDDAAAAIVRAGEVDVGPEPLNLGADREVTIRETVETIARLVGFEGELRWDPSKPDGQPRRGVDGTRAAKLLDWSPSMPFEDGLRATIDWYRANREEAERPVA